jgi:hypothetical protein
MFIVSLAGAAEKSNKHGADDKVSMSKTFFVITDDQAIVFLCP